MNSSAPSTESCFDACQQSAGAVHDIASFKEWIRTRVRALVPHGASVCVHGKTYGVGVSLDYVVTVDFPMAHLQAIRNPSGHMDTPLARMWFERQAPVFFDSDYPPEDAPTEWLASFRRHALRNAAAHGALEPARCVATYFSFHQLPSIDEKLLRSTFELLTPLLHNTFTRIIRQDQSDTARVVFNYALLNGREQEIATYISHGKSNGDIALLLGLAENTIRNQVSMIFDKTGCGNRTGLAAAVIAQEQERFGKGTKVL